MGEVKEGESMIYLAEQLTARCAFLDWAKEGEAPDEAATIIITLFFATLMLVEGRWCSTAVSKDLGSQE